MSIAYNANTTSLRDQNSVWSESPRVRELTAQEHRSFLRFSLSEPKKPSPTCAETSQSSVAESHGFPTPATPNVSAIPSDIEKTEATYSSTPVSLSFILQVARRGSTQMDIKMSSGGRRGSVQREDKREPGRRGSMQRDSRRLSVF